MLEQEIASIIQFVLDAADNPAPYYYDVPEDFYVPAAYFPSPEISTRGETFRTYAMEYAWYIKFFHSTREGAHALALAALSAIKQARNLVPLIGPGGTATGNSIRLDDPRLTATAQNQSANERGAAILKLYWSSRRPYTRPAVQKMREYHIEGWGNPDVHLQRTINAAYREATTQRINDYQSEEG